MSHVPKLTVCERAPHHLQRRLRHRRQRLQVLEPLLTPLRVARAQGRRDELLEEIGIELSPARLKCALLSFSVLKAPVDAFFEKVMVMSEDPAVRRKRLNLLYELEFEMNRVADISKLAS